MNVKLELNTAQTDQLEKAVQTRIVAGTDETIEDAFARISSGKSVSDTDRQRLQVVKEALIAGDIEREEGALKRGRALSKAEAMRLYKIVEERMQERILLDMKDNMPSNYVLVDTKEKLQAMIKDIERNTHIPIDVETTGTNVWQDIIVGYVFSSIASDTHYYVPTRHVTEETQLDHEYVKEAVRPFLEDKSKSKSGHNVGFDLHMLYNDGINVRGQLWDTQEAMKMLNENEKSYALKTLVSKYLNIPSKTYGQLFGKRGFHEVSDLKIATAYAAKDGEVTYLLEKFQRKHLENSFPKIYEYFTKIEMPLIYVICEMERTGMVIDKERAEEYGKEIKSEMADIEKRITNVLGDINLNSPVQLKEALEKHTGRQLEDTNANNTLKPLSKDFVVVKDILRFKELAKLFGTYVETLPTLVEQSTGKLMASYNQNGAKTGRFSSSGGFNAQNQPSEARQLFLADEGKVLIGADFKAQEIRAVAYLSGEPVLINAFKEEIDPYASMASMFYNKPYDEVYKNADGSDTKERKEMKVVWLATLYGMSIFSLADMLGVTKQEAEKFQEDLFDSMPKLKQWIDETKNFATTHGYVEMDKGQRRRRLPEAKQKRYSIPYGQYYAPHNESKRIHNSNINRALRQAPNAVVQGSSSIQTKTTMIEMYKLCMSKKGWRMWATIHDELNLEIPEDFTREDIEEIEKVMVNSYTWGTEVPSGTDIEVMKRWGEGVTVDDWFKRKGEK